MTTFKKILIGIDNSKYAEHAAKIGFGLARDYSAHVGLVHIIEPAFVASPTTDTSMGMPLQGAADISGIEVMDIQNELSVGIIDRTIKAYAGELEVTHFTDFGSTADGILSCSKEFKADLIVIGTHSRSGLDRLIMGSVAEEVIRNSEIPVLVIPLGEEEE